MEQFFFPPRIVRNTLLIKVLLQLQDVVCSEFDWITQNNLRDKRISPDGNKCRTKYLINRNLKCTKRSLFTSELYLRTCCSRAVIHPSTNLAEQDLTSLPHNLCSAIGQSWKWRILVNIGEYLPSRRQGKVIQFALSSSAPLVDTAKQLTKSIQAVNRDCVFIHTSGIRIQMSMTIDVINDTLLTTIDRFLIGRYQLISLPKYQLILFDRLNSENRFLSIDLDGLERNAETLVTKTFSPRDLNDLFFQCISKVTQLSTHLSVVPIFLGRNHGFSINVAIPTKGRNHQKQNKPKILNKQTEAKGGF